MMSKTVTRPTQNWKSLRWLGGIFARVVKRAQLDHPIGSIPKGEELMPKRYQVPPKFPEEAAKMVVYGSWAIAEVAANSGSGNQVGELGESVSRAARPDPPAPSRVSALLHSSR
jgi:hypothetical protein